LRGRDSRPAKISFTVGAFYSRHEAKERRPICRFASLKQRLTFQQLRVGFKVVGNCAFDTSLAVDPIATVSATLLGHGSSVNFD